MTYKYRHLAALLLMMGPVPIPPLHIGAEAQLPLTNHTRRPISAAWRSYGRTKYAAVLSGGPRKIETNL
jgi:hypothetical protein